MAETLDEQFPGIPPALLKKLNSMVPERCPEISWTTEEIMYYSGQRGLIRMLNEKYKEQNNMDPDEPLVL